MTGVDRFANRDRQHDAGMLDLEPRQVPGWGQRWKGWQDQGQR
jgi:hypothetical protein